ncbi:MAG: adenylate cyclase [Nocardioidaceae bacterium]|nr:adenylate cyclase [Nocardioidaceae bacterium]
MSHHRAVRVLAIDDQAANLRLIDAVLSPRGYDVVVCSSGSDGLARLAEDDLVDVVLLDVLMPGLDGYDVCRRIRAEPATEFLPVVMITASGEQQRARALEAGADDFVTKPFDQSELLARIASLARIKRYHDTIGRQAAELATWNQELTHRVQEQLGELERVGRLRRFLSPQVAELVMADEGLLLSHRREIVVVFFDLRNFTPFAETSEPEEVTQVLGEFHAAIGRLIHDHEGTLERFTGDGAMVFFNDPVPCSDSADRAVATALAANRTVRELAEGWRRRGFDLALGTGIAQGYATLGRIGFEDRFDYAAIGSVTNLAARLVAAAEPWQVLTTDRVLDSLVRPVADHEPLGEITPKGFAHGVRVSDISAAEVVTSRPGLEETPQRPA